MGFFPQGTALGAVLSLQLQPFFTHNFYVKEITAEIVLYYTILAKITLAPGCIKIFVFISPFDINFLCSDGISLFTYLIVLFLM